MLDYLASIDGLTGRDIKQSIIAAADSVARQGRSSIENYDIIGALDKGNDAPGFEESDTEIDLNSDEAKTKLSAAIEARLPAEQRRRGLSEQSG